MLSASHEKFVMSTVDTLTSDTLTSDNGAVDVAALMKHQYAITYSSIGHLHEAFAQVDCSIAEVNAVMDHVRQSAEPIADSKMTGVEHQLRKAMDTIRVQFSTSSQEHVTVPVGSTEGAKQILVGSSDSEVAGCESWDRGSFGEYYMATSGGHKIVQNYLHHTAAISGRLEALIWPDSGFSDNGAGAYAQIMANGIGATFPLGATSPLDATVIPCSMMARELECVRGAARSKSHNHQLFGPVEDDSHTDFRLGIMFTSRYSGAACHASTSPEALAMLEALCGGNSMEGCRAETYNLWTNSGVCKHKDDVVLQAPCASPDAAHDESLGADYEQQWSATADAPAGRHHVRVRTCPSAKLLKTMVEHMHLADGEFNLQQVTLGAWLGTAAKVTEGEVVAADVGVEPVPAEMDAKPILEQRGAAVVTVTPTEVAAEVMTTGDSATSDAAYDASYAIASKMPYTVVVRQEHLPNECAIMQKLKAGTVMAKITLSSAKMAWFKNLAGGTLHSADCADAADGSDAHELAMEIVGYQPATTATDNDNGWFIVRNSWGPSWGDNGTFKIAAGSDVCGIGVSAYVLRSVAKVDWQVQSHVTTGFQ
jgi:hypothetical protein